MIDVGAFPALIQEMGVLDFWARGFAECVKFPDSKIGKLYNFHSLNDYLASVRPPAVLLSIVISIIYMIRATALERLFRSAKWNINCLLNGATDAEGSFVNEETQVLHDSF